MSTKHIREILLRLPEINLPERSDLVAWGQMLELTRIEPACMAELMDLGWLDPVRPRTDDYLFRLRDIYRIQKLLRLRKDLEISVLGATIIVDLVERVEELEKELNELRRLV